MKTYMRIREYCTESGFPEDSMRMLVDQDRVPRKFTFKTSPKQNTPTLIIVKKFERMLENGDFREVLEA